MTRSSTSTIKSTNVRPTRPLTDGGPETAPASTREERGGSTVLIADDEELLADAYARWLDDAYATHVAYDGDEAMELLDESIDVAILDRRMAGHSGEELTGVIRDEGLGCRVALVSAHEPDLDLIGVEYDAYRVKPLTDPDELRDLIETLRRRATYSPEVQRLLALASKKADVEAYVPESTLEESDAYARLNDELDALRAELSDADETLAEEGFRTTF